jgi:uncharacterized protein YbjT (DUF2867 family)
MAERTTTHQGLTLVFGAAGRQFGTGARVVERLREQGHAVRAFVRTDDDRAARLRASGVQTVLGDLHDRRTVVPALDGVGSIYMAASDGVVDAVANVASVISALGTSPHVVLMSAASTDHNSPSGLARSRALSEELLLKQGVNLTAVRGSAFFYEIFLALHAPTIRQTGTFANCFGDSRPAWISAADGADLCASVLVHQRRHNATPFVYPPSSELLSHQQMAEIISEETDREVRYDYISPQEWESQLQAHAGDFLPPAVIQHVTTMATMWRDNTTLMRRDINPSELAMASGRRPVTFRDFVRRHRAAFGAANGEA